MHRLFLVTPRGQVDNVELRAGAIVTLGRAADNELSFPDDDGLSRHHLSFVEQDGTWSVRDLGSKNGTRVNGVTLSGDHPLQPGERVSASHVEMTYQETSGAIERVSFAADDSMNTQVSFLEDLLSDQPAGRRRSPRDWVLLRAVRELSERRPLPQLFGIILELCLEAVPAGRGVVLTLDEGDALTVEASRGGTISISGNVRDKVLRERASVLVSNVEEQSAGVSSATREQGVCSLVASPLQTEARVIGMIYLDSHDPDRRFDQDDLNLLTALANIAGIRIELEQWELRKRALVADNAENLARVAAALSHELNNPLGALKSSIDTLWRSSQRRAPLDPAERDKLDALQSELRQTLDTSLTRMQQVIARIQRFANLDRAETRSVDVTEMLEDVVALAETPPSPVAIELQCELLPRLTCKPQPLGAAISSLVAYSLESCRDEDSSRLRIAARKADDNVEIRITREGTLVPVDVLKKLFEPSFEISNQRVEARNWSLFSARQVIGDQGGELEAFSEPEGDTGFLIRLPIPA